MARNDGGPAFPVLDEPHFTFGMSLRDWFATHADVPWNAVMETLSISGEKSPTVGRMAEYRAQLKYLEADAMLVARNEEEANPDVVRLQAELDEAKARIEGLEQLRPHWAQGYSSDSIAAQTATSALSSIWALLGVPHQTAAVARLKELLAAESSK